MIIGSRELSLLATQGIVFPNYITKRKIEYY